MPRARLTLRSVNAAKPAAARYTIWDTDLTGFGLRVTPNGERSYVAKYRAGTAVRWFTIGRQGILTPDEARRQARGVLGDASKGQDPAKAKKIDRQADKIGGTVTLLCDSYVQAVEKGSLVTRFNTTKKASTLGTDKSRIERHIKPLLGSKRVRTVTSADIRQFLKDIAEGKTKRDAKTERKRGRSIVTGGKGTATRTVGLLGAIFQYAVDNGLRTDNPVHGVKKYKDRRSERFLTSKELKRLGEALAAAEAEGAHPSAIAGIRLLALTGCRKSEIGTCTWQMIDFERGYLRLTNSKTGRKDVPLSAAALSVLQGLPREEINPHVLPGIRRGQPFKGLGKVWERIRDKAKLPGVRLHDLRHTAASVGASAGDSLYVIGKLLGHKDPSTTQRYAHLADDPLKRAADRIGASIEAAMTGRVSKPIKLKPNRKTGTGRQG